MEEIKVNPVGPKASQAPIACGDRTPARRIVGIDFADQERLVTSALNRFADQFLSPALAIHLSSINEARPKIEPEPQRFDLFRADRTVLAHMPSPLAESRHALTGWQCDFPHEDLDLLQIFFHELPRHRALADSRANALCRTRSNISRSEHAGPARLQQKRRLLGCP